jgi:hypothetical protein
MEFFHFKKVIPFICHSDEVQDKIEKDSKKQRLEVFIILFSNF